MGENASFPVFLEAEDSLEGLIEVAMRKKCLEVC